MLKNNKALAILIALVIKFTLFFYLISFSPQGKFQPDSGDYLRTASVIAERGVFASENEGKLSYESFRTPGYPFFLAILHYRLKIPLEGVIFLQILLGIASAFMTYKAAQEINPKIAFLSGMIVLYSPPISIFSLQILADTLFLFLISVFIFSFIKYLKRKKINWLALSAVLLALATYVRPVSYYFCPAAAIFVAYANIRERAWGRIFHCFIFIFIAYGLIGIWLFRNHIHFGRYFFTNIQGDYRTLPAFRTDAMNEYSLGQGVAPVFNYINTAWHCFLSLMTRPGTLKYLQNHTLTVIGKVFFYPFMVFWWAGLLAGILKLKRDDYYCFFMFMAAYFVLITIGVVGKSSGERYLLPAVPSIAIISAAGWIKIKEYYWERKRIRSLQHL